jgi:hypothetical protein
MMIWRIRIACWILKATEKLSEYVTFIDFPWQQWLRQRASVLCYSTLPALLCAISNGMNKCGLGFIMLRPTIYRLAFLTLYFLSVFLIFFLKHS